MKCAIARVDPKEKFASMPKLQSVSPWQNPQSCGMSL